MRKSLTTLALMFVAAFSHAAPTIVTVTGTFTDLSTVTVSGSSFKTHVDKNGYSHSRASFLNVVFKDVEDNTLASDRLSIPSQADNWEIGSDNPRTNSSYYAHRFYFDDRNAPLRHNQISTATTGEYYISMWFRTPDHPNNCGSKYFRLYYGTHTSIDNFYMVSGCQDGVFNDWDLRGFSESGGSPDPDTVFGSTLAFQNNTWHFVEVWASTRTGEVSIWLDGSRQWTRRETCAGLDLCKDEEWMDEVNWNPGGQGIGFGWEAQSLTQCNANCPGNSVGGQFDYDDMYVSYTRARVMLCSGSTWANRGTCEMQPPTTWSDTSISFRMNQGAFANAATTYLYVITDQGETENEDVNSSGHLITIGGEVLDGSFDSDDNLTAAGFKCPCRVREEEE